VREVDARARDARFPRKTQSRQFEHLHRRPRLRRCFHGLGYLALHDIGNIFFTGSIISIFLLHCSIVGFAFNAWLEDWGGMQASSTNFYIKIFFILSSGLMINLATLFIIGSIGLLNMYAIASSGMTLIICSCLFIVLRHKFPNDQSSNFLINAINVVVSCRIFDIISIILLFLIVTLLAVFRGWGFDDAMYHMPLARSYVQHQAIVLNEYLRFPLFPQNMEMLFALALEIGGLTISGQMIAQGMAVIPIFVTSLGLIGCGVWLLGSTLPGFLSVALLFYLPVIRENIAHAEVDVGLALFSWGAILALAQWASYGCRSRGTLILAGMLAGGAAGTKMLGAVLALLLALYLLLVHRNWWRACLPYAIATIAFGSWWYIRSAVISGDPIHPVGGNIFGFFLWDASDWLGQKAEQGTHGVDKNLLYLWPALQKAGVSVWILAFISGIYVHERNSAFRLFYGIFITYFLFWFFATQIDRYLAPVFAVASFLSAYFIYRAGLGRLLSTLIARAPWLGAPHLPAALSLVILLPAAAFMYMKYDVAQRGERLQERDGYTLFQKANTLIPVFGPKLVQVGFEKDIYFFDGTVIGDWFGLGRYSSMMTCSNTSSQTDPPCQMLPPLKIVEFMKDINSGMLAVNTKLASIDLLTYERFFDLRMQNGDGVLLTLR
jgi:hypothetical protein